MNVRDLLGSWSSKLKRRAPRQTEKSADAISRREGGLYKVWSWLLPLLLGLVFGWGGMVGLEVWLDGRNRTSRPAVTAAVDPDTVQGPDMMSMTAFLETNPFRISSMPVPVDVAVGADSGDAPVVITGSLATAVVRGTHPGIGAWLEDQGQLHLILVGESFDVYTLEQVLYTAAIFRKGEEQVEKELTFGTTTASVPRPPVPGPSPVTDGGTTGQVVPADPANNKPGEINRNLVNQLMEDPFAEMRNVRIRPAEGDQGLQVQWINKDSILAQLGVQRGDVIRSINGIPFRNTVDITNAMNSLMNSDRFDVDVMRNGASTSLQYVVR